MKRLAVPVLIAAIVGEVFAALSLGDVSVPAGELFRIISVAGDVDPEIAMVIMEVRLPRALLALCVGAVLAVAGLIAQSVLRNPLAEPSLLGISSGAGLASTLLIVGLDPALGYLLPWASFAGAAAMALVVYLLSWRNGTSSMRIVLVGIGLSSLAGAATTLLSTFGDLMDVQRALIWMTGSVYDASWSKLATLLAWSVPPLALTWLAARELDVLAFGDDTARSVGQRVDLARGLMILSCTMLSGAAVAAAGLIGFVGLAAPHIARRIAGPAHTLLVPVAAMVGALLVMSSDLAGRTLIAPAQLPAGLVTALIGAPFFAYLMWERRHARA